MMAVTRVHSKHVTIVIDKHSPWKVCGSMSEVIPGDILEVPDYVIWGQVSRTEAVAVVIGMIVQCLVCYIEYCIPTISKKKSLF